MTASRLFLSASLIVLVGLAGCGRKSDVLSPYEAQLEAQREAQRAGQPAPAAPEKPVEDKRFILDGLID